MTSVEKIPYPEFSVGFLPCFSFLLTQQDSRQYLVFHLSAEPPFSSCSRYTLVRAYAHIARAYSASSQCHLSCHALWTPIVLSVLLTFLLLVYFKSFLQPRGENGKAEYYDLDANRKIAHAVLLGDCILDHRDRHGWQRQPAAKSFWIISKSKWGRRILFFKPRMATDFDKASSIIKTAVISFPHEDTPHGHGLSEPVFQHQRNICIRSSKGKVYH